MDLGPRPAYRSASARCPGCGEALREEGITLEPATGAHAPGEIVVDLCDACGGLWLDWFDGEVQALAASAEAARLERGTLPPRSSPAAPSTSARFVTADVIRAAHPTRPVSTEATAGTVREGAACPRCARSLVEELYRFQDARDGELLPGVEILRCAECAGSFVTRASAYLLLDRVREPRSLTLWETVVGWVVAMVKAPPSG